MTPVSGSRATRRALAIACIPALCIPAVGGAPVAAQDGRAAAAYDRAVGDPIPFGTTRGEAYGRLVIRNAMMVSGRGTPGTGRGMPAEGPVDIVIEGGRIVDIVNADPVSLRRAGERPTGDRVIDAEGRYVLPGLFDMHAHIPGGNDGRAGPRGTEYAFRLLLGHGVTTIREPGTGAGLEYMVEQRRLSAANEIVAPRMLLYQRWPTTTRTGNAAGHTPDEARALVQHYHRLGADGIKVSKGPGHYPDVIEALTAEVKALGMNGVAVDLKVGEVDAVIASNAGVTSIEHWYGVPDAALRGSQSFPHHYNYMDEIQRFRYAGDLWAEADRYPERISDVLDLMIRNGTAWDVTLGVYEANRDVARARTLWWRDDYGHPALLDYWEPTPEHHASYHYDWTTEDEVRWKDNYRIWMKWIREFHGRGGHLTFGSDAGSLFALYGFTSIRELELLQEAGLHPVDIVRIATTESARAVGLDDELCGIRIGCVADVIVVDGNPLKNFGVLYGGGVIWTIKEGIVFDARALLREAKWYVQSERSTIYD